MRIEITGIGQKTNSIIESIPWRIVEIACFEGAVRLEGLRKTPMKHFMHFLAGLTAGCRIQHGPRRSKYYHHIPVQVVFIRSVKPDTRWKFDIIEGEHVFCNKVFVIYFPLEIRDHMKGHGHIVHSPNMAASIDHPLAPATCDRVLP